MLETMQVEPLTSTTVSFKFTHKARSYVEDLPHTCTHAHTHIHVLTHAHTHTSTYGYADETCYLRSYDTQNCSLVAPVQLSITFRTYCTKQLNAV